jgi:2-dehydropantoate 2-reductase
MNASLLRIGIAGAGAIGCTLAARLAAGGHQVNVLARGETLAAIRRDGIRLFDLDGQHHVQVEASDNAANLGEQDLIFLCTKAQGLASLLPQLQPMIGAETVVIPVVNGVPWWYFHGEGGRYDGRRVNAVDPQSVLSQALDLRHVIGCVVFITANCPAIAVAESRT